MIADLTAERGESEFTMDMQEKISVCSRMLAEYEEEKKHNPDAVFDTSELPIDIEVMRAFVKAHEEVKKKASEPGINS